MLGIRRKGNSYQIVFHARQFKRLEGLADELRALLDEMDADSPAIQRLFPRASSDDAVNREFHDLAAQDIRERKMENLEIFEKTLGGARKERLVKLVFLKITAEEFEYWIGFLNDMRLLLGTELGIENDGWDALAAYEATGDERIVLYDYLGGLQGSLLQVHMSGEDPDHDETHWL